MSRSGVSARASIWACRFTRAMLPLFALVPAQLSSAPPPVAVQPVAFEDAQVRVVDCPAVMVVGDAEIVGVTAGHFQTTDVDGSTTGAPGAVQLIR